MKHRDLNASPSRSLEEIVKGLGSQSQQGMTGAHGVKHMSAYGDITWIREGDVGERVRTSVRELDGVMEQTRIELAEAIENLEDLNNVQLPELWDKLDKLGELDDVQEILDELDRLGSEVKEAGKLVTKGPPPDDPVIGSTLWVAPNGRVYRAVDCEEDDE